MIMLSFYLIIYSEIGTKFRKNKSAKSTSSISYFRTTRIPLLCDIFLIAAFSPSVDGDCAQEPRQCRPSAYPARALDDREDLLKFQLPALCTACSCGRVEQPALRQE